MCSTTLHMLTLLIFRRTLGVKSYYYPTFPDERLKHREVK